MQNKKYLLTLSSLFLLCACAPTEAKTLQTFDTEDDRLGAHRNANCFFGAPCLDSIGAKPILVIPVSFADAEPFSEADLAKLNAAYTGEEGETGFFSLCDFYKQSSYGKLNLDITILDPIVSDVYSDTFAFQYTVSSQALADFLNQIVDQCKASGLDSKKYDVDNDGYLDAVHLICKNKDNVIWSGQQDMTKVWWSYTDVDPNDPNKDDPQPGIYFWSAFSQLETEFYTPGIDTHTLIHETGHTLGLDDYYSYYSDEDGSPLGGVDMMDLASGDHNAVSKSLLGWVNPFVPSKEDEEFEITLHDFQSTGECLALVNHDSWNGNAYGEYFMLEYYTPTGLNKPDAEKPVAAHIGKLGNGDKIYQNPGLKVIHADTRLSVIRDVDGKRTTKGFTSSFEAESPNYVTISQSNTSTSSLSGHRLMEIIPANGQNMYGKYGNPYGNFGNQAALFGKSEYGCGSDKFDELTCAKIMRNRTKMNDGSTIPYVFEVTAQSDSEITLLVRKNA